MKRSPIRIIFLFLLIPVVCSGQDMRLGLEETPAELYKSLRLAKPNPANGEKPGLGITDRGVDLTGLMPPVGYQGELNSCTTWAAGYAVKSFQENVERKWGVDSKNHVFSPSFLYNQISEGRNAGTSFQASFAILMEQGIASLANMPYTTNLYENPSAAAFEEARSFKAESYSRVNVSVNDIKYVLDQGNCVLVAVKVHDNLRTNL